MLSAQALNRLGGGEVSSAENQVNALFVGGPWDGVRRALNRKYPTWEVAVAGPLYLAPFDLSMPAPQKVLSPRRVLYDCIASVEGLQLYMVRHDKSRMPENSMSGLLKMLAEGYRNLPRYTPYD